MQLGVDSFAAAPAGAGSAIDGVEAMRELLARVEQADHVGLDVFGIGEPHRKEFLDSAPTVILGAMAARTRRIRLTSAVTVLSAADPVRVFQQFATLDLIAGGRVDMVVGRGSFVEAFPLFGLNLDDYDALFAKKLALLLTIRAHEHVEWAGIYRPALTGQGTPAAAAADLARCGGTPASFVRAGTLGLPLMVAIIGGKRTVSGRSSTSTGTSAGGRGTRRSSYRWGCTRWATWPPRRRRPSTTSIPAMPAPLPGSAGTGLAPRDTGPVRPVARSARVVAPGQPRRGGREDQASQRGVGRRVQGDRPDGQRRPVARETPALHRVARHARRPIALRLTTGPHGPAAHAAQPPIDASERHSLGL